MCAIDGPGVNNHSGSHHLFPAFMWQIVLTDHLFCGGVLPLFLFMQIVILL
jgi:hypothetical protein